MVNCLVLKLFTNPGDALLSRGVRAESNRAKGRRVRKCCFVPAAAVLCAGAMLWAARPAFAGEPLRITGSTNRVGLPVPPGEPVLPTDSFLNRQLSPGESSQGPVLPPPGQSILIPTPKLEELVDRRKNWMFDSPNSLDRDRALEETFGIRKYEFSGTEKKAKGAVERYFEASKENSRRSKSGKEPDSLRGRDPLDRDPGDSQLMGSDPDRPGETQEPGIIEGLNPAPLFNWETRPGTLSQFGQTLPGSSAFGSGLAPVPFGQAVPGERRESQPTGNALSTTGRSWDLRRSPLTGVGDPINNPIDPTRSAINPISARKPVAPASDLADKGPERSSLPLGRTMPVSTTPGFFSGSSERLSSPFNSKPAPAGPAAAPSQRPKPMILEIPRPMF